MQPQPTTESRSKPGPRPGPLAGIKVLDVGLLVQGPQAAALMCDMGAEVIKIELPNIGDQARWLFLSNTDMRSAYYTACNRGKRSVTIDLRIAAGAAVFKRLATQADVIISNFKPGTMDQWGLGYAELNKLNPRLIWAAGSAFGPLGPDAHREGADLAGQAAGGLISTTGCDGEAPTPVGVTIADHIASQNLACGVLAAIVARASTGLGQQVEVSLLGGQIWAQAAEYSHFLLTDELPGRSNRGHPLIRALYGIFETRDGWLGLIGVPPAVKDAFFVAMGRPEIALDSRFESLLVDPADLRWLRQEMSSAFKTESTESWCKLFAEIGVRYAPVRNYREVVDDPGAWDNGYFQQLFYATGAPVRVVGTPIRMSATPLSPSIQAPELGQHTDEVLAELGLSTAEMTELRLAAAI